VKHRVVLSTFFFVSAGFAQTNAGSITGTVFDQQHAVMAGVKVTATKLATNVSQSAITSGAGVYTIPALEPGTYRLTAEITGFKKLIREPITVEASRAVAIDLEMTVGNTATEVTVSAEAPLVQQGVSTVQYGINQKAIDELPLPNQNALGVLLTIPGVVGDPGSEIPGVSLSWVAPGSGVAVSGGPTGATQYQADGVSNTSTFFGRISVSYGSDALQEVSVLANSYSAEYGRVGGGIVNMVTKSGTNQLHGTLFSFSQNDILNAAPYQNTYLYKGTLRYWRGGADVGGPVYLPKLYNGKDHTFWFFSYEPNRQYTRVSYYVRTPTDLERQGDFSKSIYAGTNVPVAIFQQFDPGSTRRIQLAPNQSYTPFPGNVIPPSQISKVGQTLANLLPKPNIPMNALGQNYFFWRSIRNTDNRYTVKADQVVTDNNRLSFRFSKVPIYGDRGFGSELTSQVPVDATTNFNVALNDTHTWGGNKVNELRLGYNRSNLARRQNNLQTSQNWFQKYGVPSRMDKGFPVIVIGDGFFSLGAGYGTHQVDNLLQLTDIFNWTKGKHSIKTGFEFQAPQQNLIDFANVMGSWNFGSSMTSKGVSTSTQTGYGMASLLLGYPAAVTMAADVIPYQYRWKYYADFLQDDFKVTPRLTLNLGVRYQIEVPRSEKHHNQGYYVNQVTTNSSGRQIPGYIQMYGLGGAQNTLWSTRYNNIEPRIGFAYRLPNWMKGSTTVVRGAYAITHVPTNGLFRTPIPDLSPKSANMAATGGKDGGWVQMDFNPLVLPTGVPAWPKDGKFVDWQNVNQIYYLNRDVTIPYRQQWNFGLGFEFGQMYGLEVNYVGSKETNLFGPQGYLYPDNLIPLARYQSLYAAGYNMSQLVPDPTGLTDENGKVIMVSYADSLRQYPTLGALQDPLQQGYNSNYNGLQVQLKRRFSHGLQFSVAYTFSKAMDDYSCSGQYCDGFAASGWGNTLPQLYNGNRSLERSVSSWDLPHIFRYFYNWDLPIGHGQPLLSGARGVLNQIIGGWKLSGLGQIQSGLPYAVTLGSSAGFPEDVGRIRPNIVPGVDPIDHNWRQNLNNATTHATPYINAMLAFSPPARFTIGNSPRVIPWLRMPTTTSYDMSIIKEFPVREQIRFAFRAELYGALNHISAKGNANNWTAFQNLDYVHYVNPPVNQSNIPVSFSDISSNIIGNRTIQLGLKLYF
jgi:hypothetical protein